MTTLPTWLDELRAIARVKEPGSRDRGTQQDLDLWEAEQEQWWTEGAKA